MAPRERKAGGTDAPLLPGSTKGKKKGAADTEVQQCFNRFHDRHVEKHGIKPMFKGGRDGRHFKEMLESLKLAGMLDLIDVFFSTTDSKVVASDYTVAALYRLAPHMRLLDRRSGPRDRRTAENLDAASRATRRRD